MTSMKSVFRWLQQRMCRHEFYIDDLSGRNAAGDVHCPCHKCGRVLKADCGLHLDGRLVGYRPTRKETP